MEGACRRPPKASKPQNSSTRLHPKAAPRCRDICSASRCPQPKSSGCSCQGASHERLPAASSRPDRSALARRVNKYAVIPGRAIARTRNLEIPRCAIAHLRSGPCGPSRNDALTIQLLVAPKNALLVEGNAAVAPEIWLDVRPRGGAVLQIEHVVYLALA